MNTALSATAMNVGPQEKYTKMYFGISQCSQKLDLSDKVEHSAGSGRLVRHGRPRRWLTYLSNAVILNLHKPALMSWKPLRG